MPAPPSHSLNRQKILDEDAYTEALSKIIKRDFFPSLEQNDATLEYMAAVEAQDEERLEMSVRRLIEIDGGKTPRFGNPLDTPLRTPRPFSPSSKTTPLADPTSNHSLDSFQQSYTSEDNSSFTRILDAENKKRKEKWSWAWEAQEKAQKRLRIEQENREVRLIENGGYIENGKIGKERRMIAGPSRLAISETAAPAPGETVGTRMITANDGGSVSSEEVLGPSIPSPSSISNQQQIAIIPATSTELSLPAPSTLLPPPALSADTPLPESSHLAVVLKEAGLPQTAVDKKLAEERQALVGDVLAKEKDTRKDVGMMSWPFKTRNSLMFPPDADSSPYDQASRLSSDVVLNAQEAKSINHSNTRLPTMDDRSGDFNSEDGASEIGGLSPTRSRIAAAISGTPYHRTSSTPRVDGFALVPEMPSPTPSLLGPERVQQLMTWGTLLSTPRVLQATEPTPFTIHDPSQRDRIGRTLAEKAGRAMSSTVPRGLLKKAIGGKPGGKDFGKMGPPSSTVSRSARAGANLSPAASNLLLRTKGTATPARLASGLSGGGGRRGEAMERTSGWGSARRREDVGRMRWSASPSPVVVRGDHTPVIRRRDDDDVPGISRAAGGRTSEATDDADREVEGSL